MSKLRKFNPSEPDLCVLKTSFFELEPFEEVVSGRVIKNVRFVERNSVDVNKGLRVEDFCLENLLASGVPLNDSVIESNSFDVVDKL